MPYNGDSPAEAWEYWFDEAPTDEVNICLAQRSKAYSSRAVIEAIAITGSRLPLIEGEKNRLQYMSGVLRRNALREIDRERAEEEDNIDRIVKYWEKEPVSPFVPTRRQIRGWLQYLSAESIKSVIHHAASWRDFKEVIDGAIAKTAKYQEEVAEEEARAKAEEAAQAERAKLAVVPVRRRRRR